MKNKITAIVVAKNEEKKISDCLEGIGWIDEILVFDNGSSDNTAKIAERYGAKVTRLPGDDFSKRKNTAAKRATKYWLLFLDADERVTPKLKKEIIAKINVNDKSIGAYAVPRKNIIFGKEFKHGGLWPDYVIRLFRKSDFLGWQGILHEQPKFTGKLSYLNSPLIHQKHDNLQEMVDKTNNWSEIEAMLMYASNHPPMNLFRFMSAMAREFWLQFGKRLIFLDGAKGLIYGLFQVFSRFVSYAKLWELQIKDK